MSDIDYSKYSYKDYKKGKKSTRVYKGKVRYNFINYEEYKSYVPSYDDNNDSEPVLEDIEMDRTDKSNNYRANNRPTNEDNYTIEDMRTKKKSKMNITSDTKNVKTKVRGNSRKRDIIAVMMVIICFMLTIVSADIISGGEIFENLAEVFATVSGVPVYYAVEVGSYADIDSARAASDMYRNVNAGGYVINDGSYRVIAAVYTNKDDAEAVVTKLINDGLSGSMYEIKGAKVNYNKYGDIGNDLEAAVNYCETIYGKLYKISIDLDKGEITENQAKIEIQTIFNETLETKNTLVERTKSYPYDDTVIMVRAELLAYCAVLENLNNDSITRPSLLADIRYSYTLIVHSYCRLLRSM